MIPYTQSHPYNHKHSGFSSYHAVWRWPKGTHQRSAAYESPRSCWWWEWRWEESIKLLKLKKKNDSRLQRNREQPRFTVVGSPNSRVGEILYSLAHITSLFSDFVLCFFSLPSYFFSSNSIIMLPTIWITSLRSFHSPTLSHRFILHHTRTFNLR